MALAGSSFGDPLTAWRRAVRRCPTRGVNTSVSVPATFTYAQALQAGLTHHRLYSLRDPGALEQVGRGIYRKADANFTDLDLLGVAKRAPEATIYLLSALARHDLTDAIPARQDIALPRDD